MWQVCSGGMRDGLIRLMKQMLIANGLIFCRDRVKNSEVVFDIFEIGKEKNIGCTNLKCNGPVQCYMH